MRTGVQAMDSKTYNKFTGKKYFLIPSSGFIGMGYKYYNWDKIDSVRYLDIIWDMHCFKRVWHL